jgi:hypothetical protein
MCSRSNLVEGERKGKGEEAGRRCLGSERAIWPGLALFLRPGDQEQVKPGLTPALDPLLLKGPRFTTKKLHSTLDRRLNNA